MTAKKEDFDIEQLINKYIDLVLNDEKVGSVYKFCKSVGIEEKVFYSEVGSISHLEKVFWEKRLERTLATLHDDPAYQEYDARQKILAFFFTWIEELTSHRSFILHQMERHKKWELFKGVLKSYKEPFEAYINGVLSEGMASGEIIERKYIDQAYAKGFWAELLFVLKFWINDDSKAFVHTDEAIEKSVNLAFEFMGKSPIDSMIDFGRFVMKTMR